MFLWHRTSRRPSPNGIRPRRWADGSFWPAMRRRPWPGSGGVSRLAVAFVAAAPAAFRGSALEAMIAARDGRAVLMGEQAEQAPEGFPVLARPFRTRDVHALLARLRRT